MEQMTIFDLLNDETPFCWDSDINEIVKRLDDFCERHGLECSEKSFRVWAHVPRHGYRLSYCIEVKRGTDITELDEIEAYAKEHGIDFDVCTGAVMFFEGEETAMLPIYTTFKDQRKKVKAKREEWER